MGIVDRYKKLQKAELNRGKPLGGGLDEKALPPLKGKAFVADLHVEKPVEQGGKKGLHVAFRLELEGLGKRRLVVETTLADQELGPFKSRLPAYADTTGLLQVFEIFTPADDDATSSERCVFVPFEAIDIQRAGKVWCHAKVKVVDREHGPIAESQEGFAIEAG